MEVSFTPNKKIGVATSGGADSMVLLTLLKNAGADIVAINIEHGIRGQSSLDDSAFVKDYCQKIGVRLYSFSVDCPKYAKENGVSLEVAGRTLRYEIFDNLIINKTVDCIALAHHGDDFVETVLMRIFRGTGIRGLRGIVDRDGYIHPLINYSKAEILDYANKNNVPYITDESNLESDFTRNYLRNEIIPLIKLKYPNINASILRMSNSFSEIDDFLSKQAIPYKKDADACKLPLSALNMHVAVAKKSIADCIRNGMGIMQDIEARHLEQIISLADKENGCSINLPYGLVAIKEYDDIVFYFKDEIKMTEDVVKLNEIYNACGMSFSIVPTGVLTKGCTFDFDKLPVGSVIRNKKQGDIFKRYGGGTKPLAEYLTDIKYPKRLRDNLIVIANENIVYAIVGKEISDDIKIDNDTKNMVKIDILTSEEANNA